MIKEPSPLIRFENDYSDGAHPNVLRWLVETNGEKSNVYSEDYLCESAKSVIKRHLQCDRAAIHFLPGGTITNMTVITAALRPYQGVVSSSVGHIATHETGAIEARGHKILTIPSKDGKLTAKDIRTLFNDHYSDPNHEHTVQPGMVYLTNPTEYGAIYTKEELTAIRRVCDSAGMYLYMDGARLGYALTADGNDLTLADLARLTDAFTIGGTKHGALLGEALVITNDSLKANFRYSIKQSGALLAKGRILGIQFLALFEDDLYFTTSRQANEKAMRIKKSLEQLGVPFYVDSPTNQQFPIFSNSTLELLCDRFTFSMIGKLGEKNSIVRICTNWSTEDKDIDELLKEIGELYS